MACYDFVFAVSNLRRNGAQPLGGYVVFQSSQEGVSAG